ncbi:hypothetical protein J5TS2_08430 [Brevibacillus halotolerans]|uniref:hypothetical protein n=1 Tax=Brevibacillus halotolerans TaxID=1507437 RepID=UPI001B0E7925|nr:hypothetical protein [Brevibacillus halotolerans]GIO00175.1 hypothetical protein J5TS2_08430 [Brevibacillus halotolerans]
MAANGRKWHQANTLVKEKDAEQIVINFAQGNEESGEAPQKTAPAFNVSYQENPYTMTFTLNGVRWFDQQTFEELKKSDLVADAYQLITLDDSSDCFVFVFIEVKEYSDPAQIVLNLSKDNQAQLKTVYSIRTAAYPLREQFALMEEALFEEKGIRGSKTKSFGNK